MLPLLELRYTDPQNRESTPRVGLSFDCGIWAYGPSGRPSNLQTFWPVPWYEICLSRETTCPVSTICDSKAQGSQDIATATWSPLSKPVRIATVSSTPLLLSPSVFLSYAVVTSTSQTWWLKITPTCYCIVYKGQEFKHTLVKSPWALQACIGQDADSSFKLTVFGKIYVLQL